MVKREKVTPHDRGSLVESGGQRTGTSPSVPRNRSQRMEKPPEGLTDKEKSQLRHVIKQTAEFYGARIEKLEERVKQLENANLLLGKEIQTKKNIALSLRRRLKKLNEARRTPQINTGRSGGSKNGTDS